MPSTAIPATENSSAESPPAAPANTRAQLDQQRYSPNAPVPPPAPAASASHSMPTTAEKFPSPASPSVPPKPPYFEYSPTNGLLLPPGSASACHSRVTHHHHGDHPLDRVNSMANDPSSSVIVSPTRSCAVHHHHASMSNADTLAPTTGTPLELVTFPVTLKFCFQCCHDHQWYAETLIAGSVISLLPLHSVAATLVESVCSRCNSNGVAVSGPTATR